MMLLTWENFALSTKKQPSELCGFCQTRTCTLWTQWALEPQIGVIRHKVNRPDFDILLMSNWQYHMDINTWGQYEGKNVSRKWPLATFLENKFLVEKTFWLKTNFAWISFNVNVWHQLDINSWCQKNFWLLVDCQLTITVNIILISIQCFFLLKMSTLCLVLIIYLP